MSAESGSLSKDVPWEWIKAARDIVKAEPRKQPDHLPVQLLPWLYLSDMPSALKLSQNNPLDITAVLTTNKIFREDDLWGITAEFAESDIRHGYVGGVDIIGYDMMKYHWEDACKFIEESLNCSNGKEEAVGTPASPPKILIHCAAGTNRSALVAGAAMIAFGTLSSDDSTHNSNHKDFTFIEVISILKKQRGFVLNNIWFIRLLAEFAQQRGQLGPKPDGYSKVALRKSELII